MSVSEVERERHHLLFAEYPKETTTDVFRLLLKKYIVDIHRIELFHSKEPCMASIEVFATLEEVKKIKKDFHHKNGLRIKILY